MKLRLVQTCETNPRLPGRAKLSVLLVVALRILPPVLISVSLVRAIDAREPTPLETLAFLLVTLCVQIGCLRRIYLRARREGRKPDYWQSW